MPLIQRDASIDHPSLSALLTKLGSPRCCYVDRIPRYAEGQSYWSIDEHVKCLGGKIIFGWMIVEVPHLFLFAWHHAIWESPNCDRQDLSAHPLTWTNPGTTLFADDPVQEYDLAWPLGFPQVFQVINAHPIVNDFIAAYQTWHHLAREESLARKSIPGATFVVASEKTIIAEGCASSEALLAEVTEKYSPLLHNLNFIQDIKLEALNKLQHALINPT